MREATLTDLIAADEPMDDYYPIGFDYEHEMARVAALREPLEALTGYALTQDHQAQDATCFTSLYAVGPGIGVSTELHLVVTFSAWSNLFCVDSSLALPLTNELRFSIAQIGQRARLSLRPGTSSAFATP